MIDYETWHAERESAAEKHEATAPWHLATLRHLPDVTDKRVLEIGCGRGVFAVELAKRGADLVAADYSEVAVGFASERLTEYGVDVRIADIQAIPFADESFEIVISQETVEHVPEPALALAELVRVTRRGGSLILTGPNYLNLLGLYRLALRLIGRRYTEQGQPVNQPLMLFRQVRLLRRLGCDINVVEGHGVPFVIPGYGTLYLPARPQRLTRWFAYETIVVATRR
jgi:2-polyprenyl-3-methyl-5-hydroxy-6-metoxy-1,4-benzoquinol methylase